MIYKASAVSSGFQTSDKERQKIFIYLLSSVSMNLMKQTLRYFILLTGLSLMAGNANAQQDPQFSMYMFDKMAVNPAAAGSKDALEANLIARDQWVDIQGAPKTVALAMQAPVASQKVGWGAEIMADQIGPTTSTSIQGNYAYHLRCGNGKLSMGLGLGLYDYVIDFSQINYRDQNDPYNSYGRSQQLVPTAEAGLYYYSRSFYAGISFNHLIEGKMTNENFDSAATFRPHAYFIMGQGFQLSKQVIFNPSILIKYVQNAPPTGDVNFDFLIDNKLWIGASYRFLYGVVAMVAYRVSPAFQLAYAYDLGINGIGNAGGGSHEICLTLDIGNRKTVQTSPRYF